MNKNHKFYICEHCKNMVGMIKNTGVPIMCCGQEMTELIPNTVDASEEKHVPDVKRKDNVIKVQIGSVLHPMTQEHHIAWIAVMQNNTTQRTEFEATDEPKAKFCIEDGPATVYEYCNIHGLWAIEI